MRSLIPKLTFATAKSATGLKKFFLFLLLTSFSSAAFSQTSEIFSTSTTWTCPAGVTSITVESWGGGGAGGGASGGFFSSAGGGGGGGGAYTKIMSVPVTPGVDYIITVGTGAKGNNGNGSNGTNTFFNGSIAVATGGLGGKEGNGAGGNGGNGTYAGGKGFTGKSGASGGGGGSAGTGANGNNSGSTTGAAAVTGGGKGGNGFTSSTSGENGGFPGGGGGGGKANAWGSNKGGNGADGQVIISYILPAPTISAISGNICTGGAITITGTNFSGIIASNVKIGATPVTSITTFSSTQIVAVVGTASSGKISVTNGGGTAISAGTFTAIPASVGGSVLGSTTVCTGNNTGSLELTGHTGNVTRWEFSTNAGSTWNAIANKSNTQNYTNLTQTTQYRAVVTNSTCSPENSAAATISVSPYNTLYWGGKGSTMPGGTNDTVFNKTTNWSITPTSFTAAGVAPNRCTDVVIDISLNATVTRATIAFTNSATTIKSLNFKVKGSTTTSNIYESGLRLGNQSLIITGSTNLYSENNASGRTTQLTLDGTHNGSLFIFEGDLITSANNKAGGGGECIVYPFSNPVGTINKGKFVLKGNAILSGVGDDAYPQLNKPSYLVFDGTGTQTIINNNNNGYPIYLGFNTLIGEVNSPTVILKGSNILGFETINNLTVKDGATLEIEALQSINRYEPGTPSNFTLMANATMKLAGNNYGIGSSNFPAKFSSITFAPTSTVEYNGTGNQTIYSTPPYGNLTVSNSGIKTASGNITMMGDANINGTATLNGSSFSHYLSGNWYNNALSTSLSGPTSTVTFQGSSNQIIGGSAGTTFNNLVINKSNSLNTVTNASAAFSSAGNLTVTRGNLVLQAIDDNYYLNNATVQPNGTITHSVSWDATYKLIGITGNLDITGIFNPTVRSHVQMNGTGSKTIRTGNNPASTLSILTFNNGNFVANGKLKTNQEVWAMFGAPGTFSTNGQDVTFAFLLNNNGTVNVNGGSLRINGGAQIGNLPNPGTLNITAGLATITGDLNIQSAGKVIVDNAKLQISGAINNPSGKFTALNGTIEMNGAVAQNIAGSMFDKKTIKNLIVSNPAALSISSTLHDTLKVSGTLSFGHSSAKLNTGNNLTLLSNAERTANLDKVGVSNIITGNATVERYINIGTSTETHRKSWQFLSVPTSGKTIKETWMEDGLLTTEPNGYGTWLSGKEGIPGGFDVYSGTPSMKTYDPLTNNWKGVSNPATTPIHNTGGYLVFVRGDRSVFNFSGANSAPTPTTLRTTGTLLTGTLPEINVLSNYYQSIGNPYASAIDFKKINRSAGIDDKFYVWDPNLGGTYGLGGYQTISSVNGWKPIPGGTTPYPTGADKSTIQSGQAFLIYTTGVGAFGPVTYSLSFDEDTKVSENTMKSFARPMGPQGENKPQLLGVSLYTGTGADDEIADGNVVAFGDSFTNSIDANDALKIVNDGENFGLKRNGKLLALEARKTVTETDTIYYHFSRLKQRTYQLRFTPENMETAGLEALLQDKFTNTLTPVNLYENSTHNISITKAPESAAPDRFLVIFRPMAPLPVTFTSVKAAQKNTDILVEWKVENERNMHSYEVEKSLNGINFTKQSEVAAINGSSNQYQWLDKNATQGYQYYRIHSKDLNGQSAYSETVKVLPGTHLPAISIYPNPAIGETINIQLSNQPIGTYNVRLVNVSGQVLYSKTFEQQSSLTTQIIKWDKTWSSGIYQLEVRKPGGEVEVIKVMR